MARNKSKSEASDEIIEHLGILVKEIEETNASIWGFA
jgi:hypothetical protein